MSCAWLILKPPPAQPWSVEKLLSTRPVPGARKVGGRCCKASALNCHLCNGKQCQESGSLPTVMEHSLHPPTCLGGLRLYRGLVAERVSIRWISWAIAIAESNAWANGWCMGARHPFLETDADAVDKGLCLRPPGVIIRKPRAVTDCLTLRREDGWCWSYCPGTWS